MYVWCIKYVHVHVYVPDNKSKGDNGHDVEKEENDEQQEICLWPHVDVLQGIWT